MQALFKHAKHFIGDGSRPIFEGIYFDGKSACVTNTHVMLVVKDYPLPERLLHYKTGKPINGHFPQYQKVIPNEYKANFSIQSTKLKIWKQMVKVALDLTKKLRVHTNVVGFKCDDEDLTLLVNNAEEKINFNCVLPVAKITEKNMPIQTSFNAQYVYDSICFFDDCDSENIEIKFANCGKHGEYMVLESDQALIVITPVYICGA